MKMIVAAVASATLLASPVFAHSQGYERQPASGIHLKHKKQSYVGYNGLYGTWRKPAQATNWGYPGYDRYYDESYWNGVGPLTHGRDPYAGTIWNGVVPY